MLCVDVRHTELLCVCVCVCMCIHVVSQAVSDSEVALAAVLAEASSGAAEAQGVHTAVQQHQQQHDSLLQQLHDCLAQATAAAAAEQAAAGSPSPSSSSSSSVPGPTAPSNASPAVQAVQGAVQDDEDGSSTADVSAGEALQMAVLPVSLAQQLAVLQGQQQQLKERVIKVSVKHRTLVDEGVETYLCPRRSSCPAPTVGVISCTAENHTCTLNDTLAHNSVSCSPFPQTHSDVPLL